MTTSRENAIALAVAALELDGDFATVYNDIPDTTDGQTPIAIVYGQGYRFDVIARRLTETPSEIACVIAVRRFAGYAAEAGQAINDLVLNAMTAFHAAGFRDIVSSAGSGIPQWINGGNEYRIERITMRMKDEV